MITDLVSFSARYENKISAPLDVKTYDVKTYTTNFYDAGHTLGIQQRENWLCMTITMLDMK